MRTLRGFPHAFLVLALVAACATSRRPADDDDTQAFLESTLETALRTHGIRPRDLAVAFLTNDGGDDVEAQVSGILKTLLAGRPAG